MKPHMIWPLRNQKLHFWLDYRSFYAIKPFMLMFSIWLEILKDVLKDRVYDLKLSLALFVVKLWLGSLKFWKRMYIHNHTFDSAATFVSSNFVVVDVDTDNWCIWWEEYDISQQPSRQSEHYCKHGSFFYVRVTSYVSSYFGFISLHASGFLEKWMYGAIFDK